MATAMAMELTKEVTIPQLQRREDFRRYVRRREHLGDAPLARLRAWHRQPSHIGPDHRQDEARIGKEERGEERRKEEFAVSPAPGWLWLLLLAGARRVPRLVLHVSGLPSPGTQAPSNRWCSGSSGRWRGPRAPSQNR